VKKLLIALLTMFAFSAHAIIGPASSSNSFDGKNVIKDRDQQFIKVKNSSAASIAVGDVVILDVADDDGAGVTTSTTATDIPICVVADAACAVGDMCKCQVYGYHSAINFDSTADDATAGQYMYISTGFAGKVEARPFTSVNSYDKPVAVFYDSPSASGTAEGFIRLLGN